MRQPTGLLAERYEVITEVPKGLASSCYFAIDTTVGRAVVVRLLGLNQARRLIACRGIKHRHVASIVDIIEGPDSAAFPNQPSTDNACAVVAEVFRGTSLRALIRRERLGIDRSVAWVLRIAEALGEIHSKGGAHGALSPFSILAKAHGRAISPVLSQLIVPPLALFASPERLMGQGPSPSDDLWALSVLLYCLLTGTVPFLGDTPTELLKSIHETNRSELTLKEGPYMRDLEFAVRRWLAPARLRRPATADDIIDVLDRWERHSPASMQSLTPIANDRKPLNLNASLAEGDVLVFDELEITDSYDAALATLQEERNLPRTASYFESRDSVPAKSQAPSSIRGGMNSVAPPPSVGLSSAPSMAPDYAGRVREPLTAEAFTHRLRGRSRWGLLSVVVALTGVAVGATLVSALGGSSNVVRTVARVVQQRTQSGASTPRAAQPQERIHPSMARDQCIRSYFPTDAFGTESELEFVCKNANLLDVAQRLNALAAAAPGSPSDGGAQSARSNNPSPRSTLPAAASNELVVTPRGISARAWQLGWYELIATGIIQRSCCPEPPAIKLPVSTGWCQQLQTVVTNIANLSTKPGDLSPAVRAFDETITCLASQGKHTVYPYKAVPTSVQKAAFQQFLTRAAEMDARRASKKFE
jgi:serine/threonine protein kinase